MERHLPQAQTPLWSNLWMIRWATPSERWQDLWGALWMNRGDAIPVQPEERGLGWTNENAYDLVERLVWDLVTDMSGGGRSLGTEVPYGCPPLSHEDGVVYRTAEQAGDSPVARYLVTSDRTFRTHNLPGDITRLYPWEWVRLVRASRFAVSAPPRP
jgi:hypothetical protein